MRSPPSATPPPRCLLLLAVDDRARHQRAPRPSSVPSPVVIMPGRMVGEVRSPGCCGISRFVVAIMPDALEPAATEPRRPSPWCPSPWCPDRPVLWARSWRWQQPQREQQRRRPRRPPARRQRAGLGRHRRRPDPGAARQARRGRPAEAPDPPARSALITAGSTLLAHPDFTPGWAFLRAKPGESGFMSMNTSLGGGPENRLRHPAFTCITQQNQRLKISETFLTLT